MREQPGVLAVHLIGPARTGRLWIQKWETHPAMAMITSHLSLSLLVHHVFILASVKRQLFSLGHGTNLRRNTADAKRGSNVMDCHRLSWPSALSHLHLKTELKQVRNLFVHVILTKIHYRFIKFVLFVTWLASILLHFPVQVDFTVSPVS